MPLTFAQNYVLWQMRDSQSLQKLRRRVISFLLNGSCTGSGSTTVYNHSLWYSQYMYVKDQLVKVGRETRMKKYYFAEMIEF